MARPAFTRLKWVSAKKPETIERYLAGMGMRVEIKTLVWQDSQKLWFLWFVPDDASKVFVISGRLKE